MNAPRLQEAPKPATHRPHGTRVKFVVEKCRCLRCRAAHRAYENNRRRQRAYGRKPYVDAEPVRQHVLALRAAGIGRRQLSALSGVSENTISKLLTGCPARGMGPSKGVRPDTARKILAIRPRRENVAGKVHIDATGTHRRLQALVAIGWNQTRLAERLGLSRANFGTMMHQAKVTAATASKVRALYDELWDKHPPESTRNERTAASKARNQARANGWAPPAAWDDDAIDHPDARPQGVTNLPTNRRKLLPPVDEIQKLLDSGDTVAFIAQRFKARPASIRSALSRARRTQAA